jgi:uncharacterized surface anchored protein
MAAWIFLTAVLMQSPECSISGRVYSLSTGAPLKKAQVRLAGEGVNARLSEAATTTDAEGNFRFDHLGAGKYFLVADRNGYLTYPGSKVSCGSTDVTIKMTPQAMIYGRVIDDDGEPVSNALVSVGRRTWIRGQRQAQMVQGTTSQADGSFVLGNLSPGNYYLSAKGNMRPPQGEAFVENFFPNTTDLQSAAPIGVAAGADMRGLELRVRSVRVYTIRGKATNASGEDFNGGPLMLIHTTGLNHGSMQNAGTAGGVFEFRNVAPGNYVIQALPFRDAPGGGPAKLTAHVPVTVGEGDLEGVQVALTPGAEIPGSVKLGDSRFSQSLSVMLEPSNGAGVDNNAQVRDGAFAFHSVAPTLYHVEIQNLLDGYCLKSMRFGGRELVRRELDLSAGGGGTLEILLSAKPATIGGTVRNSNGEPVADATVNVWTKDDPDIHTARTDASGHFSLRNFAPGEYRVIAWEQIERGVIENPSFRAAFESQAAVVTLREGAEENVDLKLIPKSAGDAEVAKLQ